MNELEEWYAAGCPWEGERGTVFMEMYLLAQRNLAEKTERAAESPTSL